MLSFINSNTRLSGCCFASHTHCQTPKLHPSIIQFLTHNHWNTLLPQCLFLKKKERYKQRFRLESAKLKMDLGEQEEANLTWQAELSQL